MYCQIYVTWCDTNPLDLNVGKTKEIIIDFREGTPDHVASSIHDEEGERVDTYKYLGTVFDSRLKFDKNTEAVVKKGRVHLL